MTEQQIATRQVSSFRYRVARLKVRVVRGRDRGAVAVADGTELTIGSARGNDLRLSDPAVSRHHCLIEATPEGARIRDLGSTNGVLLAGCRVEAGILAPGAVLRLGDTEVAFEHSGGEVTEDVAREESFGPFIGASVALRRMFALLPRIADSDSTVLIEGETGTGKSLLAEAIHQESPRRDRPFIVVDCGAIPSTLIESELFGHEKGSFTGAHVTRTGYFEAAEGGTIFLDEIGELPLELQPRLLRVLEDRVLRRVGSPEVRRVDVRVIAATNRDLRHEVNRGGFRSDLWYRLAIVKVRIPPLRERPEDIPRLVEHLYGELSGDASARPDRDLLERMSRHDWPGNVRELRSAVERAILFDEVPLHDEAIGTGEPQPGPTAVDSTQPFRAAKGLAMAHWERAYLADLIRRHDSNISAAARAARMNRNHLRDLLVRYGLTR
jgi:two-component system, NtrC family, response regulator GlrR